MRPLKEVPGNEGAKPLQLVRSMGKAGCDSIGWGRNTQGTGTELHDHLARHRNSGTPD